MLYSWCPTFYRPVHSFLWLLELQNPKGNNGNIHCISFFVSALKLLIAVMQQHLRREVYVCSKKIKILDPVNCLFCQDLRNIVLRYDFKRLEDVHPLISIIELEETAHLSEKMFNLYSSVKVFCYSNYQCTAGLLCFFLEHIFLKLLINPLNT